METIVASAGDEITVMLVGDIYVQRPDPSGVFRHIRPTLATADIVIGNLEGAYSDGGTPWPKGGINAWKADAKQMQAIAEGGFHAMSVTNNHIMDFGYDGLLETLSNLDRIGVAHAGAGRDATEAYAPAIIERAGTKVALLAYTSVFVPGWEALDKRPGLAVMAARTAYEPPARFIENPGRAPRVLTWMLPDSKARLAKDIAEARRAADCVICSFHWGVSEGHVPLTDYQVELGHHAAECGADFIFGHHPHLMQGVEFHKNVPIFYSLGNLTFARHNKAKGHELETMIVRARLRGGRIVEVDYMPVLTDANLDPHVLPLAEARQVISIIETRSAAFGTRFSPCRDCMLVEAG
jgi:poly-gamma-glutamate synthesis protein (capsule biosynthesis protein)